MRFIGRWLLAFFLVPLSVLVGLMGLIWHLFTARRARREYEHLKTQGRVANPPEL